MKPKNKNPSLSVFKRCLLFLFLTFMFSHSIALFSQEESAGSDAGALLNYDRIRADGAFRDGVLWLHQGRINDAILSFQQALSFDPGDMLSRQWLGRAYYFGGYDEAALREFEQVSDAGAGSAALSSLIETLKLRRGFVSEVPQDQEFFPLAAFNLQIPGGGGGAEVSNEATRPSQAPVQTRPLPAGISARRDGWYYVANLTGNSIQLYDANGTLRRSITGGLLGLQAPFDVAQLDNGLIAVSSFRSDEIVILDGNTGAEIRRFGGTGIGPGELLGPQFIAYDPEGYIFVTDYGNQRIQKFTLSGEFLFSIGAIPGIDNGPITFNRPHGILWYKNSLWIVDRHEGEGVLYQMDGSGNLISSHQDPRLLYAESLSRVENRDAILVTTKNEILNFYPDTKDLVEIFRSPLESGGYVSSQFDRNGNLLVTDSILRQVNILSRLSGLYSGLHIQINRINADSFPQVRIEFSIQDRLGKPIVGLESTNFLLTEANNPVENPALITRGYQIPFLSLQLIVPSSARLMNQHEVDSIRVQLESIFSMLQGADSVNLIAGTRSPSMILQNSDISKGISLSELQAIGNAGPEAFDLSVRMAANRLVRQDGIKHILYFAAGGLAETAFTTYGLEELRGFMVNNEITFSVVWHQNSPVDPALSYLIEETGGQIFQPQQIADGQTLRNILAVNYPGRYIYEYRSRFDGDFGRRYLPVEVEVNYLTKSGRDESGYFSPLIF